MTLIRVVDYVASYGGGCRFTAEMLRAFRRNSDTRFEVVSHGPGLLTYRALLGQDFPVRDLPPANAFRAVPPWAGRPGARVLNALFGTNHFHFEVPSTAFEGCDLAWLPWVQRHRLPAAQADRAIGTLHDLIYVEFPGILPEAWRRGEIETLSGWFRSSARLVVSSRATLASIEKLFGPILARPAVVPLSSKHDRPALPEPRPSWSFSGRPYLLCPTNIGRHKNLDVLLEAFAAWGAKVPLVVTGPWTDLKLPRNPRVRQLESLIRRLGLVVGRDLFMLGYVEDRDYYAILEGAWALVMPTLAEGGGSFPVLEAMESGIPVLSSNIPVMREMAEWSHGDLMWFDPRDPADLARQLAELEAGYPEHRARAQRQVKSLAARSWDDVARDYARLMGLELRAVEAG